MLKTSTTGESWLTGRLPLPRWLPVVAIMALGVVLRLWSPKFGEDLWYDETFSLMTAKLPIGEMISRLLLGGESSPPLYTFLLHFWIKLGSSDAHIKLLSVLLGTASVWAIYLLTSRVANHLAALVSCLLLTVSESAIHFSIEARAYALFLFLSLLSTYFFASALLGTQPGQRFGSKSVWAGYTVVTALVLYSHWFGLLLLAVHAVGLIIYRPPTLRPVFHFALSMAIIGCLCVPLAPLLANQIKVAEPAGGLSWPGQPNLRSVLDLALFTTGGRGLLVLTFALLIVALYRVRSHPWNEKIKKSMTFVTTFVLLPVITTYVVSSASPRYSFFVFRYLLPFVVGVYILIGMMLSTLGRVTTLAFLAAFLVVPILSIVKHRDAPKKSYSRLSSETCLNVETGGVLIAHLSPMSYFPVRHYRYCDVNEKLIWNEGARRNDLIGFNINSGMINRADWEDVGKVLQEYRELWLVIDPGDIGKSTRAVWKRIQEDSDFSLESEEQFGNLRMERYRKGVALSYREVEEKSPAQSPAVTRTDN